jgi:hypothetical protein
MSVPTASVVGKVIGRVFALIFTQEDTIMSTIMHDNPSADSEGTHACSAIWDAETAQRMDEMIERCTGHPCPGNIGGRCPVLPRALTEAATA